MNRVKSYIGGALVAVVLFYFPSFKKWKFFDKKMNENNDDKTRHRIESNLLKTIKLNEAILNDDNTLYGSSLFGQTVLFHKITDGKDYDFQNYAFAGNIVNVYHCDNKIKFDVKLFLSTTGVCLSELNKIVRKEISKDLILKGFERSELNLA